MYQGSNGDTDYYVIPADIVPILLPLGQLGVPRPILLALDEPLRVLIETGYQRNINPGTPTPILLISFVNPITLSVNLVSSIPVGLDDAFADIGVGRVLGTTPSGPYVVGGPPLPPPPVTKLAATNVASTVPAAQTSHVESTENPPATTGRRAHARRAHPGADASSGSQWIGRCVHDTTDYRPAAVRCP